MTRRTAWFGSLYWRIVLACLGLLVSGLVVQLAVVVATLSRPTGLQARIAAQHLAETIAEELEDALDADPAADVRRVFARHLETRMPIAFVTVDGVVLSPERKPVADADARHLIALVQDADAAANRDDGPAGVAPVDVLGAREGHVVVLPRRPGFAVLRELGPWAIGSAILTAVGLAALLAWVAFSPAHRRLRALEAAAGRLGDGDLTARAPEDGADEISRVSAAFNQTADALAAQIRRATHEQEVRRQLLADVSHELHTPLTAIRGYVETLRMPDVPITEADRARFLAIVDDEAVRLERLIGELLDLAKVDAGGQSLRQDVVPIEALWARLRDRHGPDAARAGIGLAFDGTSHTVTADAGRLEQALSNLVANALRFTPSGGEVRVSAHAQQDGGTRFDVADTGVGLSADECARVFDRFYKHDGSRSRGGAGLGLSIVRAIAQAHGGDAHVASTPGKGSTFSVVIADSRETGTDKKGASTG